VCVCMCVCVCVCVCVFVCVCVCWCVCVGGVYVFVCVYIYTHTHTNYSLLCQTKNARIQDPRHGSLRQSLAFRRGGTGSILAIPLCLLMWTEWYWDRVFFGSILPVSFHKYSILIHMTQTLCNFRTDSVGKQHTRINIKYNGEAVHWLTDCINS